MHRTALIAISCFMVISCFLIAGCAVEPTRMQQGEALVVIPAVVGKSLEYFQLRQPLGEEFSLVEIPPGRSVLYFYREKRFKGGAIDISIRVDDIHITDLQNGSFAVVIVDAGEHEISFPEGVIPPGDLALPSAVERAKQIPHKRLRISAPADSAVFMKAAASPGWTMASVSLEEQPNDTAMREIRATRRSPMALPAQ